jgi:hypothetical protein
MRQQNSCLQALLAAPFYMRISELQRAIEARSESCETAIPSI